MSFNFGGDERNFSHYMGSTGCRYFSSDALPKISGNLFESLRKVLSTFPRLREQNMRPNGRYFVLAGHSGSVPGW